jgi:hypothetical protein
MHYPGNVKLRKADVACLFALSERTPDEWRTHGRVGHGIHARVALTEEFETSPPSFQLARPNRIVPSSAPKEALK